MTRKRFNEYVGRFGAYAVMSYGGVTGDPKVVLAAYGRMYRTAPGTSAAMMTKRIRDRVFAYWRSRHFEGCGIIAGEESRGRST